jgi:hypothetical protein
LKAHPFNLLAAVVAAAAGLITLAGYFIPLGLLHDARLWLLSLVSALAAWAVLAGALNLVIVHSRRFGGQAPGGVYSLFVLLGIGLVLVLNIASPLAGWGDGAASPVNTWLLNTLIATGGAALAGVIAFFLVYAGYRLLRRHRPGRTAPPAPMTAAFLVAALLGLLVLAPWPAGAPNPDLGGYTLRDLLAGLTQVPAAAGARGLLLGIALGVVATGLRLLMGLHRPYGE